MRAHISNQLTYHHLLITYFPFLNPPTLYIVTKGYYLLTFLRIKILSVPILVHNGVHQPTVIIIGVDTFNVTSEQLTAVPSKTFVTSRPCCVVCGVGGGGDVWWVSDTNCRVGSLVQITCGCAYPSALRSVSVSRLQSSTIWCDYDIYDMMRMRLDVNTWMTFIRDFTISTVICHINTWFELWFLNIWCRVCDNECQKIKVTYPGCHSKNPGEFIRGNYFKSHWVKLEPGQNRYQTSYTYLNWN